MVERVTTPAVRTVTHDKWYSQTYLHKGKVYYNNMLLCMGNSTNQSGNSRGRKLHLSADGKTTLCNLKRESSFTDSTWSSKNFCLVCFNNL